MLAIKVLLEVVAIGESPQAFNCRQAFLVETKDALSNFAFD